MTSSFRLFNAFGIPVKADWSLIILAFLMISEYGDPFYGIAAGVLLLASVLLHELGHSLVAVAFGCRIRDITLMMIGGCATLLTMPRKAWQEFLMALAGPAVSLALSLGALGWLLLAPAAPRGFLGFALHYLFALNAGLFVFNMLPAFPMDGGRIFRAFLQQFFTTKVKATWIASRLGRLIAILMALSVVFSFFTGRFQGFMFIRLLIAWFIYTSAEAEYRAVLIEEGYTNPNPFARFFGGKSADHVPPPDDGQVYVSPPPYKRHGERIDLKRDDR